MGLEFRAFFAFPLSFLQLVSTAKFLILPSQNATLFLDANATLFFRSVPQPQFFVATKRPPEPTDEDPPVPFERLLSIFEGYWPPLLSTVQSYCFFSLCLLRIFFRGQCAYYSHTFRLVQPLPKASFSLIPRNRSFPKFGICACRASLWFLPIVQPPKALTPILIFVPSLGQDNDFFSSHHPYSPQNFIAGPFSLRVFLSVSCDFE